ncbi:MAG: hypothetical protein JKP90_06660 [Desulfofustis sp. PB-SRB1]|nr:hypothetical protein [Desulfofustis sp. PB-SRB1]
MGYLAATSRKLAEPLSVLIQSRSAAGKSTLQDAISLADSPMKSISNTPRVTDQALFYKEEDSLVHKILAIEEAEGMGGAAYSIRTIQSQEDHRGRHRQGCQRQDEDRGIHGKRPRSVVMITTTATEIDQETASRFIF